MIHTYIHGTYFLIHIMYHVSCTYLMPVQYSMIAVQEEVNFSLFDVKITKANAAAAAVAAGASRAAATPMPRPKWSTRAPSTSSGSQPSAAHARASAHAAAPSVA